MLQSLGERIRLCYRRTAQARERAQAASDPETKTDFLKMERQCLRLAGSHGPGERISEFMRPGFVPGICRPFDRHSALISIVDDDEAARGGIQALVDSLGYTTAGFPSAEDFLSSQVVAATTCLITDMQMPGLNGLELQQALRSRGNETPIIVITGRPNEKHRTSALDAGAIGFLSKPIDEQSLIECLSVAMKSAN
jgi:CheY-like chemotaxis protein